MSSTSDSSRQLELQRELDEIIRRSARLPIDWDDEDHRPIIGGANTNDDTLGALSQLHAMTLDLLEESGAKDAELHAHIARCASKLNADNAPGGVCSPAPAAPSSQAHSSRRNQRFIYASRKASALELLTTVRPILRHACRTPLDATLQAMLTGLETLAAIIVEKIDDLGQSETIGASLLYRGDGGSRFLASPLYTVVDLRPDIYAYSTSHLVRVLNEEVRRTCQAGRVVYVANTDALIYKATVQMTAHCEFRSLHVGAPPKMRSLRYTLLDDDRHRVNVERADDDETWLEALLGGTRPDEELHGFDVAISSVSSTVDSKTILELKRKIAQSLRHFFGEIGADGPYRERVASVSVRPPPLMSTLIHDALVERPSRRVFAAADGERTVWASDDAFAGEAP